MNVTVYIEYENDNTSFDVSEDYYNNENNYANALLNSYNQTKDAIYETMSNGFQQNTAYFSQFNNKQINKNEKKHYYASCEATLLTENLDNETENGLLRNLKNNDIFINIFDFNFDTSDEEFETEFKMWITTHNKINSTNQNEDWKFQNEPKRDLRIKYISKNNIERFILLQNCKIIDNINNKGYAILIERISFIKQI